MKFTLHKFQEKAFLSQKRIIALAAGIQSGKSLEGALWIGTKAIKAKPDRNLIIAAPTYKILAQATLPKFLSIFDRKYGTWKKVDSLFKWHHGPTTYVRSLTDPNALEGISDVEGAWLDEGGLISRYAWENVDGRTARTQAQIMITTTPYALNWLYLMWLDWKAKKRDDIEFIQFTSKDNPHFPEAEFERQRKLLDPRRFSMKYCGQFGKMEGLVYENVNTCKAKILPNGTMYYAGVDWGFTNPFALSIRALTPDGIHYRVGEFMKSGLTIDDVVQVCKQRAQIYNIQMFVCDPSSPANILALSKAGLAASAGNNEIRLGIDKQIELFKTERFFIFEDENPLGLDEYSTYHYPELKDLGTDDKQKEQEPVAANNHSCFRSGTRIRTPMGMVPIEKIKNNDLVHTPLGTRRVLFAGKTGFAPIFRAKFSNGTYFDCTRDHPIYQFRKNFTLMQIGSIVSVWNQKSHILMAIATIGMESIFLVLRTQKSGCIEQFGNSFSEKFRKVFTFTIRTEIGGIILQKILNVFQKLTIKTYIEKRLAFAVNQKDPWLTLKRSVAKQKRGMQAKRDWNGIGNTEKEQWKNGLLLKKYASNVMPVLKQKVLKQSIARQIVSKLQDVEVVLTTMNQYVRFAIKPLLKNIQEQKPVVLNAVVPLGFQEDVFNLAIEDAGCFYAEDILVSNCDADRYLSLYLETAQNQKRRPAIVPGERGLPKDPLDRIEYLKRRGGRRL